MRAGGNRPFVPEVESMPFGGVGPAGTGHYYGKYAFDVLTRAEAMLIYTPETSAALKQWFEY